MLLNPAAGKGSGAAILKWQLESHAEEDIAWNIHGFEDF